MSNDKINSTDNLDDELVIGENIMTKIRSSIPPPPPQKDKDKKAAPTLVKREKEEVSVSKVLEQKMFAPPQFGAQANAPKFDYTPPPPPKSNAWIWVLAAIALAAITAGTIFYVQSGYELPPEKDYFAALPEDKNTTDTAGTKANENTAGGSAGSAAGDAPGVVERQKVVLPFSFEVAGHPLANTRWVAPDGKAHVEFLATGIYVIKSDSVFSANPWRVVNAERVRDNNGFTFVLSEDKKNLTQQKGRSIFVWNKTTNVETKITEVKTAKAAAGAVTDTQSTTKKNAAGNASTTAGATAGRTAGGNVTAGTAGAPAKLKTFQEELAYLLDWRQKQFLKNFAQANTRDKAALEALRLTTDVTDKEAAEILAEALQAVSVNETFLVPEPTAKTSPAMRQLWDIKRERDKAFDIAKNAANRATKPYLEGLEARARAAMKFDVIGSIQSAITENAKPPAPQSRSPKMTPFLGARWRSDLDWIEFNADGTAELSWERWPHRCDLGSDPAQIHIAYKNSISGKLTVRLAPDGKSIIEEMPTPGKVRIKK